MRRFALALLLPLVACTTPRDQCERNATEDLRIVSALIVETEQNIARGYAITREQVETPRLTFCYGGPLDSGDVGVGFCNEIVTKTVERPVAIDLDAEKAKLAALRKKQAELKARAAAALAACAAQYPG